MRCKSCNKLLSEFEATRKYAESKEYLDLCNECYLPIAEEIEIVERLDLMKEEDGYYNG